MMGQKYSFAMFVTKNKDYQKTLESEFFMEDRFKWDEYYYDNRNVRILQTNIVKIG